jgi:hypothetical protein
MRLRNLISIIANIATIALVGLVAVLLLKGNSIRRPAIAPANTLTASPGTSMKKLPSGIDWTDKRPTLLFALQTTCHFCTESAPFFRKLTADTSGKFRTVAVLPQPMATARKYLDGLGLHMDEVSQASLERIGVTGTPTLMLIDSSGTVKNLWQGAPDSTKQAELLKELAGESSHQEDASQEESAAGMKTVRLERQRPGDPVSVVQVFDGNMDVTPTGTGRNPITGEPNRRTTGKPFSAPDDWLKSLVVVIKNFSDKEIVAGSFRLDFPQTGNGTESEPMGSWPVTLGREPEQALYMPNGEKRSPSSAQPLNLLPGQELKVPVAPYYGAMKEALDENGHPASLITTCWVRLQFFYFADGTRWSPHTFQKPDPNVPGKYVVESPDEFKGTK